MTWDLMRGCLARGVDIGLRDGGRVRKIMTRLRAHRLESGSIHFEKLI